jgi:hypothetical protein
MGLGWLGLLAACIFSVTKRLATACPRSRDFLRTRAKRFPYYPQSFFTPKRNKIPHQPGC